mmetsp:Transcript_112732/g.176077  ORF Transcript_112732/g.176077 Transcript_112732/m.176077 type:complete len:272 (+) Transcript_112732:604-1419(+)
MAPRARLDASPSLLAFTLSFAFALGRIFPLIFSLSFGLPFGRWLIPIIFTFALALALAFGLSFTFRRRLIPIILTFAFALRLTLTLAFGRRLFAFAFAFAFCLCLSFTFAFAFSFRLSLTLSFTLGLSFALTFSLAFSLAFGLSFATAFAATTTASTRLRQLFCVNFLHQRLVNGRLVTLVCSIQSLFRQCDLDERNALRGGYLVQTFFLGFPLIDDFLLSQLRDLVQTLETAFHDLCQCYSLCQSITCRCDNNLRMIKFPINLRGTGNIG